MIEKLIMVGVLKDVNVGCTLVLLSRIDKYLKEQKAVRCHPRAYQRTKILARKLAISHAIECLFNMPGAKYHGVPFHISQLLDIEVMLRDTEEIAYFVICMQWDQFVDPNLDKVTRAIISLFNKQNTNQSCMYKDLSNRASMQKRAGGTSAAYGGDGGGGRSNISANPEDSALGDASFTSQHQARLQSGNNVAPTNPRSDAHSTVEFDYNYIQFRLAAKSLSRSLYTECTSESKPSDGQIHMVLRSLSNRTVTSKPYKRAQAIDGTITHVLDEAAVATTWPLVEITAKDTYVHVSLLAEAAAVGASREFLLAALAYTYHAFTPKRNIIVGIPFDDAHPGIFASVTTKPVPGACFRFENVLFLDRMSRIILDDPDAKGGEGEEFGREPGEHLRPLEPGPGEEVEPVANVETVSMDRVVPHLMIDVTLDEWITKRRLKEVEMPFDLDSVIRYGPEFTEEHIKAHPANQKSLFVGYPDQYVGSIAADIAQWDKAAKGGLAQIRAAYPKAFVSHDISTASRADMEIDEDEERQDMERDDDDDDGIQDTLEKIRQKRKQRDVVAYGRVTGHTEVDSSAAAPSRDDDSSKGKEEEDEDEDDALEALNWSDEEEEAAPPKRSRN